MSNIEDILVSVSKNDVQIPIRVQNRINYTLKNKTIKKHHYFKKIITAIISIICTMAGTFGVYALTGGKIEGIPATDWLGIKFSSKYVDYKQPVENQKIVFKNTSVELTSTLCNEGITILEFDVKLSEEDAKKLKIGESIITEEYLQEQEKNKAKAMEDAKKDAIMRKYYTEPRAGKYISINDVTLTDDELNEAYEKRLAEINKSIEERQNSTYVPAISLNYMQEGGTYNYDKFNPDTVWYGSIYIDDQPYYVRNWQRTEQISEYEYKVYTMYSISDDVLNGKDDFKINLKNNKLTTNINWVSRNNSWSNDCQWFARNNEETAIDLPGEFEVNVSKNDILKDSKVIENPGIKSEFRNITQTVEKVVASPVQTIVRINHSATQQSSNAFSGRYSNPNIEYLPLTREYKVYDANGKELSCFSTSNKNTLIYADGTREDYDYHDIPNKKYSNAIWETIEYLLIENTDTDYIKIVPVETVRNPVDGVEDHGGETYYEMDSLVINLK